MPRKKTTASAASCGKAKKPAKKKTEAPKSSKCACKPCQKVDRKKLAPTPRCSNLWSHLYNPFKAGADFKYPDGKMGSSWSYTTREPVYLSGKPTYAVALFGGLVNHAAVYSHNGQAWALERAVGEVPVVFENDGDGIRTKVDSTSIMGWRPVCAAMKVTLLSDVKNDGGFWAAYRFNDTPTQYLVPLIQVTDAAKQLTNARPGSVVGYLDDAQGAPVGVKNMEGRLDDLMNMNSTGQHQASGLLRDIDKEVFLLNPTDQDNDVLTLEQSIRVTDASALQAGAGNAAVQKSTSQVAGGTALINLTTDAVGRNTLHTFTKQLLSPAWDCVVLLLRGLEPSPAEAGGQPKPRTQLLLETVCHYEYNPTRSYAYASTPSYANTKELDKWRSSRTRFGSAPNQPAYGFS